MEEAIPKFFGQSKYPSFTRQLSGWGFNRLLRGGPDFGCYYHECFLRGHPRLTVLMRRISPGKGRAAVSTAVEPDLYVIAKQFPLHGSDMQGYSSTETKAKEASTSQQIAATGSLPADSLAPTTLLNPQGEFPAEDETVRVHTTMLHHHNYPAAGNLYQHVEAHGRSQGGLAPTRNVHQQRYEGLHVQRPHLQSHSHDDLLMFRQMNGNINSYSQLRPDSISGIQWQAQDQHNSSAAITIPSGSSQNPWLFTAANEDSLHHMPVSIPDPGFDINVSSVLDSFGDSSLDPTTIFSDYNRTA